MSTPPPFRSHLPTREEIKGSRLLIQKYQLEIDDYTIRLNELRSLFEEATDPAVLTDFNDTIQDLSARIEIAKKLCSEQEVFISSIRKLPSELLAMILVFHVTDNGHTPWTVLSVCRSWRNIALGTPWMWNKIHVQIAYGPVVPYFSLPDWSRSHFTGGILCREYKQLEFVLKRSGVIPLDIKLETGGNTMSTSWGETMNLLWTQNGHRWRHVEVKDHYGHSQPSKDWMASNPSLPLLESLRIESEYPGDAIRNLLGIVEKTSTKLHTLHISRVRHTSLAAVPKLMRQIRHASWQYTSLTSGVWTNSSRLESLAVMGQLSSPFTGIPEKYYTRLHTLAMSFADIVGLNASGEHLKSLTHVALCHIEPPINAETPQLHSILLPAVTHFTLVSQTYKILPQFVLPSLESLELYGCTQNERDANEVLDAIWNPETFGKCPCPSKVLHLETSANGAYILAALRLMQNVKQLFFHYESPSLFGSKLIASFDQGPRKATIKAGEAAVRAWKAPQCPQLEELIIVCKKTSMKDRVLCMDELKKIQQARCGTASEMKHVDVLERKRLGSVSENRAHDLLPDFQ